MATLILIDGDAELLRARALVDQLWNSTHPGDFARLEAQARLVAAYEEMKWPRRPPSVADLIRGSARPHPSCSASEEAATTSHA
jgi:HTH-type transcriptional regulator/antitoxin HigA